MRYLSGYREIIESVFQFQLKGLKEELINRRSLWSIYELTGALSTSGSFGTSISDIPEYVSICKVASENEDILRIFKRCYEYRLVLEHVSRRQGKEYLQFFENETSVVENLLHFAKQEVGEPFRYSFSGLGKISPTQIRYAKIVSDLKILFPGIKSGKFVEVGVGNGGLAAQISRYFESSSYTLVDLPEVLKLTSKVLSICSPDFSFQYVSPKKISHIVSDLFISNYAFSELTKKAQDLYFDNYICKAKAGYMIYNHIHQDSNKSYSAYEMKKRIPDSQILPENPLTYPGNVLLVWGHQNV